MALTLTDDQTALRDSARDFLSEQSARQGIAPAA
jgi:hypothetical protein